MAHTSEYEIEDIFIDRLEGIGYKFIKLNNYDEVLANFREQLAKFNAKKLEEKGHTASFSDSEFNRIMIHVDNHSVYESAKVLRDKYDLQLDNGESVYIEFFSGDTDRNIYQVTHQVTMDKAHKDDVVYKNRYDVTVLINGLPLVQIELKRPGVEINEAINQINRYRKFSFKGIFRYLQLFVVSNSVQTKYFCNENEMLDGQYNPILKSLVFFWTDEKNTRINDLNTFTGEFFRKSAITEMLNKYMVIKTTEPVLMVMRPYQIYAVKAAKKRVLEVNQNGYVFACTGSGKTLTSFKLAQILRDEHSQELLERCMKDYKDLFGVEFTFGTFDAYRKDITRRLKQQDSPQIDILLVVNMFLTGFDAKPLNTLYLDKNLIWHSLVQAYSRTNRVDKVTKQFGQIVTYRNIKKWQDDALTLFSGDGDPNEYLLENFEYYLNQWKNQELVLRRIAPNVDVAGQLKSEDEIRRFIIAFRSMAKTLAVLKTFTEFDWKKLEKVLDEDEYEGFKSWYLYYKDQTHNPNPRVSVPVDVDFDIELVRTDRINVVYILNLLKNANNYNKTEEEKQQDVDLILREIERSDNESLRLKKEVMKQFILTRFYDLPEGADVMEAFMQFEKEQMQADMEEFAFGNEIDYMIVSELFNEYAFHGTISNDDIRKRLTEYKLNILKMTKLTKSVKTFIEDMYNKYKAEGE